MKLMIDISKDKYDEIMSMDWTNCRRFFDEEIRAIHDGKALEQEPTDTWSIKDIADTFKEHGLIREQEPCEDAISRRDMALNIVSFYNKATGKKKTLDFLCKCVEGLPSVQPKQKTGRWRDTGSGQECSECGEIQYGYDNFRYFCAYCGANMQEVEDATDN